MKKVYIILISIIINWSFKNPMLFFFKQLGIPFSLYLIWVGLSSCILAFVVFNLKNSNSKDKLTFLNYLYIFAVSIIFTCIFNILAGYLYLDLLISWAAVISISIWRVDFLFKPWELATKFDFKDLFKPKEYLGGNEGLSSSTGNIKLIEPDLNNYKKGTPSGESAVSDNESRPVSAASNYNSSDCGSIGDSSLKVGWWYELFKLQKDIEEKLNQFKADLQKAAVEKPQPSTSLKEEKPKLSEPEPNLDMNIKLALDIICRKDALSEKHVKLLELRTGVYNTCIKITGTDTMIESKITELKSLGIQANKATESVIVKGQRQLSYEVVKACVDIQLDFNKESTKLANEIFNMQIEKVRKANPGNFKDFNKEVFRPVEVESGNTQRELKRLKSEILTELAKLKK